MAIRNGLRNDPRLYSGGSAVVNTQPHVALYANLLARQAARKDAFDEYMRNLNKGINTAGMRNIDRPAFDQKLNDFQKFGMDHSNEIRNRQNGADIKYMNDYQDLQNLAQESKTEEEKKKPVVEMLLDPNKRDRLNTDSVMGALHQHDQPLYISDNNGNLVRNPNRKSLDINSIQFNPKQMDTEKYFKGFDDIKKSELPPTTAFDPKTMLNTVTTTSVLDKDAKDLVAQRAVAHMMSGQDNFRDTVNSLDPKDYNDFFKQNYGRDINPQTKEADLAAAYTLKGLQNKLTTTKVEPAIYQRDLALLNKREGFESWLRKQPTYGEMQKNKDDVLGASNVLNEVKSILLNPKDISSSDKGSNVEFKLSEPTILNQFKGLSKVTSDPPTDATYSFKNNKVNLIFSDKDGNEVDRQELDPKTYLKLKVKQSFPNKDIGNINNMIDKYYDDNGGNLYDVMKSLDKGQSAKKAPAVNQATYQYKGKAINQSQLENAAKLSGMTVEEYKKAVGIK